MDLDLDLDLDMNKIACLDTNLLRCDLFWRLGSKGKERKGKVWDVVVIFFLGG